MLRVSLCIHFSSYVAYTTIEAIVCHTCEVYLYVRHRILITQYSTSVLTKEMWFHLFWWSKNCLLFFSSWHNQFFHLWHNINVCMLRFALLHIAYSSLLWNIYCSLYLLYQIKFFFHRFAFRIGMDNKLLQLNNYQIYTAIYCFVKHKLKGSVEV
jgi:hypothetical protein